MDSARLEALVNWIGQHPIAAGLVIFLIAFGDALVIVGVAIPAVPLLFAVGTLVGLGHVDGTYALVCATLGAFLGDAISYWVGLPLRPAAAPALALQQASAVARARRNHLPPPRHEEHRDGALRRRHPPVRAGHRRHAQDEAAPVHAGQRDARR